MLSEEEMGIITAVYLNCFMLHCAITHINRVPQDHLPSVNGESLPHFTFYRPKDLIPSTTMFYCSGVELLSLNHSFHQQDCLTQQYPNPNWAAQTASSQTSPLYSWHFHIKISLFMWYLDKNYNGSLKCGLHHQMDLVLCLQPYTALTMGCGKRMSNVFVVS